jgi:hypothetical protein
MVNNTCLTLISIGKPLPKGLKMPFQAYLFTQFMVILLCFFLLDSIPTRKDLYHAPIGNYLDGADQPYSLVKYKI